MDLKKDSAVLHDAYNDSEGVTAAFNLNLLERINRELNADFRPHWFNIMLSIILKRGASRCIW